jgi:hypothetical protein
METVDPKVLDFWEAYDSLYPINDYDEHKREYASMISMLQRFMALYSSAHGVPMDLMFDNDFLPKRLRYKIEPKIESGKDVEAKAVAGLRLMT